MRGKSWNTHNSSLECVFLMQECIYLPLKECSSLQKFTRSSSFKSYHLMVNHRWDDPIKSVSWITNQAPVRGGTSGWADRQAGRVSGGHPEKSSCALLIRESSHCSPLSACHPLPNEHIQHRLMLSPVCHLSLARRARAGGSAAQVSHEKR